ncbi:oligopeptide ABC transporter permease [Vallitalea sp.]|jgi:peptide/nickel transport system permease protein|uniref:oligopeptide ABC transporter permease n=1 Tax=Vallitalea sp. TaxID=1882829 RepID=UPI0025F0A805|nr:oligopeptide ABC transporter permease [Vallitalea sp.]MCT4686406.1 ABC transporter permease [Vallitalea sp.]
MLEKSKIDINDEQVTSNDREIVVDKIITPGQLVMKRFVRNKLAIIGIVILVSMFLISFIGPFFSPYGEYEIFFQKDGVEFTEDIENYDDENIKVLIKAPPSSKHWLGTDRDGRDTFTRLMYGGRISLVIGFVVVAIELFLGVILGGIAGYFGGKTDNIIMRIVDIFFCIPFLPIVLILSSALITLEVPGSQKIYYLMLVLGILGWASVARLVRGQILSLREQEFMIATEAIGLKPRKRIFKHLIPNVMPQLIVLATLGVGGIILTESALSFLGFGVPFPFASWGNMVSAVTDPIILKKYLYIWIPPGICILATVMGFNFVGDGLRDAFDPKMRR